MGGGHEQAGRMKSAATATGRAVGQGTIFRFWSPLAIQWLMMSVEGPFLAAVIARMGDATLNLAAYGVAFAFAILTESPVIMLMSASTALVKDALSYRRLRNFTAVMNATCTALIVLVVIPPVFDAIMLGLLRLPGDVAGRVHGALWLLLPWPAAIGYRRFLHGVLIRSGRTRLVAYGTVLRLAGMGASALLLHAFTQLPGAWIGALALSTGVCSEALAAHFMARGTVRELLAGATMTEAGAVRPPPEDIGEAGAGAQEVSAVSGMLQATSFVGAPDYREIARFYYPLALTSLIGLTVQPLLTFFMGRAPSPVESLAVFPVVHSLSFLFRALGVSFQEAAIALLGDHGENFRALRTFATALAVFSSGALALLAFTPLAQVWFVDVSGLPRALADVAIIPLRISAVLPALTVLSSLQQATLVQGRWTRPITIASALEVGGIAVLFLVFGWKVGMLGATAAWLAQVGGRVAANAYLVVPVQRTRRVLVKAAALR